MSELSLSWIKDYKEHDAPGPFLRFTITNEAELSVYFDVYGHQVSNLIMKIIGLAYDPR